MVCNHDHDNDNDNDEESRVAAVLSRAVDDGTLPIEAVDALLTTVLMAKDALKMGLMTELDVEDEGFLSGSMSELCHLAQRLKQHVPALTREQN